MLSSTALIAMRPAHAECGPDSDWPERPCLDAGPYSESYMKEVWQKYYDYKGKDWMEAKKAEMDQAIKAGTLREWIEQRSEPDNHANYNVYYYYRLNGQAPDAFAYPTNNMPIYEYASPVWVAAIAGIGIAGAAAALYVFRKARQK
jgi:hypothetical protein